jgi:hypothetical protein
MKYLLVAGGLVAILASLAAALVFMMRDGRNGERKTSRMAWALALRVGLSIALFLCVLVAWKLGYIRPTGIVPGQ